MTQPFWRKAESMTIYDLGQVFQVATARTLTPDMGGSVPMSTVTGTLDGVPGRVALRQDRALIVTETFNGLPLRGLYALAAPGLLHVRVLLEAADGKEVIQEVTYGGTFAVAWANPYE